jgi:ABC-type lipoprotein export system ATPase subunit
LRESNSPLVIDQPEDNLDSQLVFDLVVDILRRLKNKRQIIIATHNPNIPVSGDAEQVIVVEAESGNRAVVNHQASVDEEKIISSIKNIMEGGEEAFKTRARKYRYLP